MKKFRPLFNNFGFLSIWPVYNEYTAWPKKSKTEFREWNENDRKNQGNQRNRKDLAQQKNQSQKSILLNSLLLVISLTDHPRPIKEEIILDAKNLVLVQWNRSNHQRINLITPLNRLLKLKMLIRLQLQEVKTTFYLVWGVGTFFRGIKNCDRKLNIILYSKSH